MSADDVAMEDYDGHEHALADFLEQNPQLERRDVYQAHKAGWSARIARARASLGYSAHAEDAVMHETIRLMEQHMGHLDRIAFGNYRAASERRREADRLRQMIRERGFDPSEAPAWRRITEQRKQLRSLLRQNRELKEALAAADEARARLGITKEEA